ncbi:hypothetical protein ACXYMO_00935 [Arenibacterium sp. CAU 1754]
MPRISSSLINRTFAFILLQICVVFWAVAAQANAPISAFEGDYAGSAKVEMADGTSAQRDMSVSIRETKEGFTVKWTSTTYKPDGRGKEKSYQISFVPSDRAGVFAAAMTKNVFGHAVPLDPMKGEPYVWARIQDQTLTVFSLFVNADGGYEMQQFDRTLADGGLDLNFKRFRNGEAQSAVSTFLKRE